MIDLDRLEKIMEILNRKKRVSQKELETVLYCSAATVRRCLIHLEQDGQVKRIRGGAVLNSPKNVEYAHSYRSTENTKEKKALAELAMDFVSPNMCLFLDSSTTVLELIPHLEKIPNLIILTNGLLTALELGKSNNPTLKVYVAEGEIKTHSGSIIGTNFSSSLFNHFRVDLGFYSCRGIDEKGIYEASLSQAMSKKFLLEKSVQNILLVDHSKFSSPHFFEVSDFTNYEAIITDKEPGKDYLLLAENFDFEWCY